MAKTTAQIVETDPGASLLVSPGPHIHAPISTQSAMLTVIASLLPAAGVAVYLFGWPALGVMVASIAGAMITEALCLWARKRPILLWDGSAALTGLLLAFTLPPQLPLWMAFLGGVVGIGIGKHAFGGLGANPFNPALVGRAFLTVSFAAPMSTWPRPFDGVTGATPLVEIAATGTYSDLWSLVTGATGGSLGETSAVALVVGGIALILKGIVDWRIPAGNYRDDGDLCPACRRRSHRPRLVGWAAPGSVFHGDGLGHFADHPQREMDLRGGHRRVDDGD